MKENGKDKIQFLVLKSSQLVKKGKISFGRVREQVIGRKKPSEKGGVSEAREVAGGWEVGHV